MEHLENRELNLCSLDGVLRHEVTSFQRGHPPVPWARCTGAQRRLFWMWLIRQWRCFFEYRANRDRCACESGYAAIHLAAAVYQSGMPKPTHADCVAILRATRTLARKYPNKFVLIGGKGRMPPLLNPAAFRA